MTPIICISVVAYFREVLTILYHIADCQRKEHCSPSIFAKVNKTLQLCSYFSSISKQGSTVELH